MPRHITTAEKLAAFLYRFSSFEKSAKLADVKLSNYETVRLVERLRGDPQFEVWLELARHQMSVYGLGSVFTTGKKRQAGKGP